MISKKIAMLGMWGVGKTSLVQQFVNSIYDDKYHATLGVKVDKKVVNTGEKDINLMLWDIAGAEDNFSVPMNYVKGAAGYLLVLDGTRAASLESAAELVDIVKKDVGNIPFVIMINKSDLDWEITEADVERVLGQHGQPWFSGSAKTGENVDLAFHTLAGKLI